MWRLLNPIAVGRAVFTPSRPDRVEDPAVKKVQVWRSVIGFGAVVLIAMVYRLAVDTKDLVDQRGDQIEASVNMTAITFPIVLAVFIAATRPPNRQVFLRRALKPLGALAALIGSIGSILLIADTPLVHLSKNAKPSPEAYAQLAFLLFVLLWIVPFVFYGIAMALVHVFRTADVHEALPPVLATLLVWELAISDLVTGAYEGAPFGVRMALTFGGPLSITAVSLWELRRLQTRHGLTLRRALLR
ncbi:MULTISPECIES: hypothetical protein [unclassified Streptomyces]|uniref:hypothetical protein n=1 Tax=unclassified Streptomyces TaxID=2593676 RepID=UPI00324D049D